MLKRLWILAVMMLVLTGCDLLPATQAPADTPTSPPPLASPTAAAATATATPTEPSPTDTPTATDTPEPPEVSQPALRVVPAASLIDPILGQDPGDPQRLAYCSPQAVQLSADGGASWDSLPVDGLATALAGTGYELRPSFNQPQPACLAVTLDSAHPDSLFLMAETQNQQFGAPPVFFMGFYTTDRGQSWQLMPLPEAGLIENFGGFWSDGQGTVQALYLKDSTDQVPLVRQTLDGGATWQPAGLACPPDGPCLRWGAAPSNIPGMGSPLPQYLFRSQDGGDTWVVAAGPVELRFQGQKMLAVQPDGTAELLTGYESPYLQRSTDGGATWLPVELPPLPASDSADYHGLQPLPQEAYIAQGNGNQWYRWQPLDDWCPLAPGILPERLMLLRFTAEQALWIHPDSTALSSLLLAELQCPMQ